MFFGRIFPFLLLSGQLCEELVFEVVELACLFKPEPHKLHVSLAFVSQFLLELLALDLEVRVHKHAGFNVVR